MRSTPWAILLIAALAAFPARAELSDEPLLGLGVRSRPAYDGSATQRVEWVPVLRALGQPWFARSTQGVLEAGLRAAVAPGLHAAAQLAYEPGRDPRDAAWLADHGVSAVDASASVGAQLEWDLQFGPMPVTLLLRGRQHIEAARGAQVDLRVSAGALRSGRFAAGVFAQSVWANPRSAASLYDVDPQLSASSGLPVFHAEGGQMSASLGALWSFELDREWIVVGNLEWRRLQSDVASSPLVQQRMNHSASVGIAWRFQ